MPEPHRDEELAIRERAYFIWEREGRPEGRAHFHWLSAIIEASGRKSAHDEDLMEDEERVLAGRADANIPALLTKDVRGG